MLYFAYGSNLHPIRLRQRVPSSHAVGPGTVAGYQLRFHKRGADGSGKGNLWFTGACEDVVFGALYRIDVDERVLLDRAEGLGVGYTHLELEVASAAGAHLAFAYAAQRQWIDESLRPLDWYLALVLEGARRHALPAHWIDRLASEQALADCDAERASHHRQIVDSS